MSKIDFFEVIRLNEEEVFNNKIDLIDLFKKNEYNQNLLHEAISNNRTMMTEVLIKKGIDVNHCDKNGQTPLHYAALYKNPEIVKLIIEKRGNLHISDKYGNEPLWTAVFNARGEYTIVKLLMDKGANASHKNTSGSSPLDFAKQIKDKDLISILCCYDSD